MDIPTLPDLINPIKTPALPSDVTRSISKAGGREEALEVAKQFEAFFLHTILEDIIPEPEEDAFGGGSHAEKVWSSMLNEKYAELLSESGGVGIATMIYQQLLTLQEAQGETQQQLQYNKQNTLYKLDEGNSK